MNSVRNAIALIMQERGYHKLWIPHYLCCSVRKMLETHSHLNMIIIPLMIVFFPYWKTSFPERSNPIVNFFGAAG